MSVTAPTASDDRKVFSKERTFCRICHAQCSLVVEMEDGKPVKFYGDKDNPVSKGFTCVKGREILGYHHLPTRLLTSLKRVENEFQPIESTQAINEIAEKLSAIIAQYGPRAVAVYSGTFAFFNTLNLSFLQFFMEAIGSKMFFSVAAIDQPGKLIAHSLHGYWQGGWYRDPDEIDVALLVGQNPVISIGGAFGFSPAANIRQARKRGMKLIVCDPRRGETAQLADVFLQPLPGQDVAILAGMIRIVLTEDLYDKDFVSSESMGLEVLQSAVSAFTPQTVQARTGVPAADLIAAARTYAAGKKGLLVCGTGPNMAPRGCLTEYLGRCLVTLCGHWPRAGETVHNPGVLFRPRAPAVAATTGPMPGWGFGEKLRVHNLTDTASGMPTAALADEILTPGDGQVRALIVLGGNPLLAFPDQQKAFRAMNSLDLLVCIDPKLSATAKLGHYVLAPKLPLEVSGVTSFNEQIGTWGLIWGYDIPYTQYTPVMMDPPAGSDLLEEWQFLYGIAQKMGIGLRMKPAPYSNQQESEEHAYPLDMSRNYSTEEMLDVLFAGSPVPFAEVRVKAKNGHVFNVQPQKIQPKPVGWSAQFQLADAVMMAELGEVAAEMPMVNVAFPFLLISRRLRDHYNSNWHEAEPLKRQYSINPAFMNPEDMLRLALSENSIVKISSDSGEIMGVVMNAPEVRAGCVSMSHGWGVNPDEQEQPTRLGGCTSRLSSTDRDCDPYSWMARQSAIPVNVTRCTIPPI